jgi:hypothetical protein
MAVAGLGDTVLCVANQGIVSGKSLARENRQRRAAESPLARPQGTRQLPLPDRRWLDFVFQLGEVDAAGGDIRDGLFGAGSAATKPT